MLFRSRDAIAEFWDGRDMFALPIPHSLVQIDTAKFAGRNFLLLGEHHTQTTKEMARTVGDMLRVSRSIAARSGACIDMWLENGDGEEQRRAEPNVPRDYIALRDRLGSAVTLGLSGGAGKYILRYLRSNLTKSARQGQLGHMRLHNWDTREIGRAHV